MNNLKKNIIFYLLFFLNNFFAYGQNEIPIFPYDSATNRITYSEVVYVDSSASKLELYSRSREWFAKTYNSSNDVIQMEDKESGKVIGKALMGVSHKALGRFYDAGYINYTISIQSKEGRYKYEITDFHHTGQLFSNGNRVPDYGPCENMINTKDKTAGVSNQKMYSYLLSQLDAKMKELIESLKNHMTSNKSNSKKDDW
jgi:hypothetical protein